MSEASNLPAPVAARPTVTPAAAAGVTVVAVVTLSHLVNDSFTSLLSPLLPDLRERFGASIAQTGILVAILSFVGSMIQPLLGMVGDRTDRRVLAALGPVLAAVGMTTIGYAPSFAAVGALVALGGIGSALFHPSGAAYVAAGSRPDRRGLYASIFSAGGTVGIAVGPLLATALDLRLLPALMPLGILTGIASWQVTPSTAGRSGPRRSLADYASVFRGPIRTLWGMSVMRSLSTVAYSSLIGFVLTGAGFAAHIGPSLAVFSFSSSVGGIVGGRLSDRYGRTRVLRSSVLATVPLFVWLTFSRPDQPWYYPLTFVVGALVNANVPVAVVAAQEYAPGHVATASAMMMGFSWGTAGVLFPLVGKLADLWSPQAAMVASILVLVPAYALAVRLPEPPKAAVS